MGKERRRTLAIRIGHHRLGHEQAAAPSVWICTECFDVYDARPAGGHCPTPGHAPVRLYETPVRSPASRDTGPGSEGIALAA